MRTSQGCIGRRIRLLFFFGSVLLVCFKASAEPITFARAIALTKQHVGKHRFTCRGRERICRPERIAAQLRVPGVSDRSDVDCESLPGGILEGAGCQAHLRPRWTRSNSETGCLTVDRSGGSDEAITNTAMEYIQLVWASAQLSARKQQHELARRLVVVERMRARAGVDDDVALYRAKLLEAQTRMRAANAEVVVLVLRQALAAQIGVSEASLEIVPDSVPGLPTIEDNHRIRAGRFPARRIRALEQQVKEATAARDAAQLAYYLAHRDANRTSASTTATLGDQITSHIREEEKFGVLLSEITALQQYEFPFCWLTRVVLKGGQQATHSSVANRWFRSNLASQPGRKRFQRRLKGTALDGAERGSCKE